MKGHNFKRYDTNGEKYLYNQLQHIIMPYKTIAVSEETKKELNNLKIHRRETYEDVIKRLIEKCKQK